MQTAKNRDKNLAGKTLWRENASPEKPLEHKRNHSLAQKVPFHPWTTLFAPISTLGAISVLTVS